MIIKILLIAAAIAIGLVVLRERASGHHVLIRRVIGLVVVLLAIVAVLWPMLTTYVANAVGVGRGTDLVLYVLVVVFVFNAVAMTQRIHGLEQTVAVLVRELAIDRAAQLEPSTLPGASSGAENTQDS